MNKRYSKLLLIIIFAFAIGGCKIDAPVYPEGTVPSAEFLNGNGGGTGGVSNGSSITYTVDGKTTTLKPAFFQVIPTSQLPPDGSTQIGGGTDPSTAFSLMAETVVKGTFDAGVIILGSSTGEGKVTFTEINVGSNGLKGTVKGTFTGKISNFNDQTEKDISGSFSIKM